MIVSGAYFLLLDPSRRFLGKRASRRIKLRDMRMYVRMFVQRIVDLMFE